MAETYIDRMEIELSDLIKKTDGLAEFMGEKNYQDLTVVEKWLDADQFDALCRYCKALEARISIAKFINKKANHG